MSAGHILYLYFNNKMPELVKNPTITGNPPANWVANEAGSFPGDETFKFSWDGITDTGKVGYGVLWTLLESTDYTLSFDVDFGAFVPGIDLEVGWCPDSNLDSANWSHIDYILCNPSLNNGTHTYTFNTGIFPVAYSFFCIGFKLTGENTTYNTISNVSITGPLPPPVSDFSATPLSGEMPLTVQFTDLSTGVIATWLWDFKNDGTATSPSQNPTYVYQESGTYTVKLTASNGGGSDSETKVAYITVINAPYIQQYNIGSEGMAIIAPTKGGTPNAILNATGITSTRVYALPNASGIISLGNSFDSLTPVTSVDNPGLDTNIPTEKAVRDAINSIPGSAITVLDSASIDLNDASPQVLMTVPTGNDATITNILLYGNNLPVSTASYSFGYNSTPYNDVIASATHTELIDDTIYTVLTPKVGAKIGASTQQFKALVNVLEGTPSTVSSIILGFLT
jgi:PKD repeat protein